MVCRLSKKWALRGPNFQMFQAKRHFWQEWSMFCICFRFALVFTICYTSTIWKQCPIKYQIPSIGVNIAYFQLHKIFPIRRNKMRKILSIIFLLIEIFLLSFSSYPIWLLYTCLFIFSLRVHFLAHKNHMPAAVALSSLFSPPFFFGFENIHVSMHLLLLVVYLCVSI